MGVELQKSSYACAVRNVEINGLLDRIDIFNTDVCESGALKAEIIERNKRKGILRDGHVDVVVSNPPYIQVADGMRSDNLEKMIARHELKATLGDFVNCAAMILKPKGGFYMDHRLTRMADIFCTLREHSLEPKELRPISSYKETAPNIMLIHAVKNGGNGLKILKNMCIYKEKGIYSDEIIDIYER